MKPKMHGCHRKKLEEIAADIKAGNDITKHHQDILDAAQRLMVLEHALAWVSSSEPRNAPAYVERMCDGAHNALNQNIIPGV